MSRLTVSNLHPAGSEFFQDSESFLVDLTDYELYTSRGGISISLISRISIIQVPASEDIFAPSISFIR